MSHNPVYGQLPSCRQYTHDILSLPTTPFLIMSGACPLS
jgi:hypothetical protein